MDLVFVGDRCCDHSPSSGYDQLCALYPEAGWLSGRPLLGDPPHGGELRWIRPPARMIGTSRTVFHVFYGDCSGRALPALLRARFPRATVVSTIHLPVERLVRDATAMRSLDPIDAAITVSRVQARQLAELMPSLPIYAVPHGVWPAVFRPASGSAPSSRRTVLVVGSTLRDWSGADYVLARLANQGIGSVVVGAAACDRLSISSPLVERRPKVPESELARLYDRAAALFLPALEATASNALLEAMSAGCPVVCPRLPSLVDEYVGDGSDSYEPGSYDDAVTLLRDYVSQPQRRATRSPILAARAEVFEWSRLAQRYSAAYQAVSAAGITPRTAPASG